MKKEEKGRKSHYVWVMNTSSPRGSIELHPLFLNLITQFDWVKGLFSESKNNNDLERVSPPYLLFPGPARSLIWYHTKDRDIMNLKLFSAGDWMGKRGQSMSPGKCRWHLNHGFLRVLLLFEKVLVQYWMLWRMSVFLFARLSEQDIWYLEIHSKVSMCVLKW